MRCIECQKPFVQKNTTGPKRLKFCSPKCTYTNRNNKRSRGRSKICKGCNKEFSDSSRVNNCKLCKKCFEYRTDVYKYGISGETAEQLRSIKNCMICKSTKTLCIDHDHKTGEVRGILCHKCNTGLGSFSENIDFLKDAVIYLQEKL